MFLNDNYNCVIYLGNWSNLLPSIELINKDYNSSLERIFKKMKII